MIIANVIMFFVFCLDGSQFDTPVGVSLEFLDEANEEFDFGDDEEMPLAIDFEGDELPQDDGEFYVIDGITFARSHSLGRQFLLDFGDGLKPWQWFTCSLMHADIVHLIGNMIFLWSFGLVVEGKLGSLFFLLFYNGIGAIQAMLHQVFLLLSDGGAALGASAAIFGLLAAVIVWAPVNEFETFIWFVRPFTLEVPHYIFGGIYIGLNVVFWYMAGTIASTPGLHMMGVLVGLPLSFYLLWQGYVDCEGYDLVSTWSGKQGKESNVGKAKARARRKKIRERAQAAQPALSDPLPNYERMQQQVSDAIAQGQIDVAIKLQNALTLKNPHLVWRQSDMQNLISALLKLKRMDEAVHYMELHVDMFSDRRFVMQANMAKVWLGQERPKRVLRLLQHIVYAELSDAEKQIYVKLVSAAKKQIADGVVEI